MTLRVKTGPCNKVMDRTYENMEIVKISNRLDQICLAAWPPTFCSQIYCEINDLNNKYGKGTRD